MSRHITCGICSDVKTSNPPGGFVIEIIESDIGNRHIELWSEPLDNCEIVDQIIAAIMGWA